MNEQATVETRRRLEQASVEHTMTMIADVIEERGLAVGAYINDATGSCCVFGAYYIVMHPQNAHPIQWEAATWRSNWRRGPVDDMLEVIAKRAGYDGVVSWNDLADAGTIVAALRKGVPDEHRV